MASKRNVVFANNQIYHIFNRGVERRTIFTDKREYQRMFDTLWYYRHAHVPMTLSAYFALGNDIQKKLAQRLNNDTHHAVSILAYCLMPNHFHLLLQQNEEYGISKVLANVSNSYTKYFNTKHRKRVGPLLQGTFKAVRIETDEQLVHVSRYIHVNPIASFLLEASDILTYPWFSLHEYHHQGKNGLCDTEPLLSMFQNRQAYMKFVLDQIDYAKTLDRITHLAFDEEATKEKVRT